MIRHQAITLDEAGIGSHSIAQQLGVSDRSVRRWIKRKRDGESLEDHPRPGRPSKTPQLEKAVKAALKSRKHGSVRRVAAKVSDELQDISKSTVHRMAQALLDYRASPSKPLLTPRHKEARLEFARTNIRRRHAFWDRVVFTDEKIFLLFGGPRKVWVDKGQTPPPRRTVKHPPHIMVHGAISGLGLVSLVRVEGKLNAAQLQRILAQELAPAAEELLGDDWVFQQDSTEHGVHGAKSVRDWLENNVPAYLRPWPAQSPDLNPIEHVWAKLSTEVDRRAATSVEELWQVVQEEWQKLQLDFLQSLTQSMPRRLRAVLDAEGDVTKY